VTLTTAVYTLPLETIYYHGRNAFLIILAFTLLAIILLIADKLGISGETSSPSAAPVPVHSASQSRSETVQAEYTQPPVRNEQVSNFSQDSEPDTPEPEVVLPPEDFHEEIFAEEEQQPLIFQEQEADTDEPETVTEPSSEDFAPEEPAGLFSPETGMGWESYLEVRLDAELSRAAAAEEDMALVTIDLPDIKRGDEVSLAAAQNMLDYFKFRDFVFELGETGFAGILQNENLDRAMTLSEELYNDINATLKEHGVTSRVAIGISTRIFRLIPGSRLIDEARQAMEKAYEETTLPIVAFRANPEKYRDYIAEKMQKRGQ
jgi:GGDEF domain-containing protein